MRSQDKYTGSARAPQHSADGFRCSTDGWECAIGYLPAVWSDDVAEADLAYWEARACSPPTLEDLARRWGWSVTRVRNFVAGGEG